MGIRGGYDAHSWRTPRRLSPVRRIHQFNRSDCPAPSQPVEERPVQQTVRTEDAIGMRDMAEAAEFYNAPRHNRRMSAQRHPRQIFHQQGGVIDAEGSCQLVETLPVRLWREERDEVDFILSPRHPDLRPRNHQQLDPRLSGVPPCGRLDVGHKVDREVIGDGQEPEPSLKRTLDYLPGGGLLWATIVSRHQRAVRV